MTARKPVAPPPEQLMTLPTRIKYARERARMTKTALAKKARMTPPQITRLESGERVAGIAAATILRLADALGVPVGWLAADEGSPPIVPLFREGGDRRRKPGRD